MGSATTASADGSINTQARGQPTADKAEIDEVRFEAIRNGRYHLARRSWYEWLHRITMFVVIMAGATAVAAIFGNEKYLVLLATAAGTIDLVFSFGEKGSQHARLQELSYEVLASIDSEADDKSGACRQGRAALARIYAAEPKTMRIVDALAYNDTKEGLEKEASGDLIVLRLRHRLLRHVIAFDGVPMKQAKDLPEGKLPDGRLTRLWKRITFSNPNST
jgi:hypothetical protein